MSKNTPSDLQNSEHYAFDRDKVVILEQQSGRLGTGADVQSTFLWLLLGPISMTGRVTITHLNQFKYCTVLQNTRKDVF